MMAFETLEADAEYLVFGCIRETEKKHSNLIYPCGDKDICLQYYLVPFYWDSDRKHRDISISNDNVTISHSGCNALIIAKTIVDIQTVHRGMGITINEKPDKNVCFSKEIVSASFLREATQRNNN